MQPTNAQRMQMYTNMVTSRYYEETIATIYMEGKTPKFDMAAGTIPGEMHLSNGQEPVAVGVCAHLLPGDAVTATHRPHHIAIAKGVNLDAMTAEIFGKQSGLSGGRGGHMHLFDPAVNFACSGIIAEGMGPAAGAALAFQMRGEPNVAVAFIGEGAANQGAFHEVMNLAAVWSLPFVCVIEDNAWGISVAKSGSTAIPHNDVRASAYGIPGHRVGNDPEAIFAVAGEAIAKARDGGGPTLIEVETLRMAGHFIGDAEGYREETEKQQLSDRDPIPAYRGVVLATDGALTEEQLDSAESNAKARVDSAVALAREAPEPQPEEALEKVFAEINHG
ncbi:MAG: thiamine pyrophosphate-dependent dehydrogenase E1 component subunit alpha [Pseudomonadota bacterium]